VWRFNRETPDFGVGFAAEQGEIHTPVLMDTVMGPRAPERSRSTFRNGVSFNHTTNFFYKIMVLEITSKIPVKCSKKENREQHFSGMAG
jgi:hypothetical protein